MSNEKQYVPGDENGIAQVINMYLAGEIDVYRARAALAKLFEFAHSAVILEGLMIALAGHKPSGRNVCCCQVPKTVISVHLAPDAPASDVAQAVAAALGIEPCGGL